MIRLGEPGLTLSDTVEAPALLIESDPGTGVFQAVPWLGDGFDVRRAANEIPTAQVWLNIAEVYRAGTGGTNTPLLDWQLRGNDGTAVNPRRLLGGRRIQIRTTRFGGQDDWIIFEGFIERVELAFSGSSRRGGRSLQVYCTGTISAADREPSQQLWGQWRRKYDAELARIQGGHPPNETRACIHVGALPLILNPGGRANCDPNYVTLNDGAKVYIPCDPERSDAIPFTLAKALRYVQWAAVQPVLTPTPPGGYPDTPYEGSMAGLTAQNWTNYRLQHENLTELLAAQAGGLALLDAAPDSGSGAVGRNALLRALPDIALEGMSVLEALFFLADRASGVFAPVFSAESGGEVRSGLRLCLRGYRKAEGASPSNGSQSMAWPLRLASDRTISPADGEKAALRASAMTEGSLVLDETGRRSSVQIVGDGAQYEMTVDLRPGWLPDEWWDNLAPGQLDAAIARTYTQEWAARYVAGYATVANFRQYRKVGRYWVLNEDGDFSRTAMRRTIGPWSTEASWAPYDFAAASGGNVTQLAQRGHNGWSLRRRRFLEPRALDIIQSNELPYAQRVGITVQVSFDGGTTWSHRLADVVNEADRCAITFVTPDLRSIRKLDALAADQQFVEAYLRGNLRVRVTANIESDDGLWDHQTGGSQQFSRAWCDAVDRRGRFGQLYRGSCRDAFLTDYAFNYPDAGQPEQVASQARALARVLRDEAAILRVSGQVTLPYLLNPSRSAAWEGYDVGDEITGLVTGSGGTDIWFEDNGRAPRIRAVAHRWRTMRAECSTSLTIEDSMLSADDAVAPAIRHGVSMGIPV